MLWFPVIMWAFVLVGAAAAWWRQPPPRSGRKLVRALIFLVLLFPVGLEGLWAALGHLVFPGPVAAAAGWQPSPFQLEVGVSNLGRGVVGIAAAFYASWPFRLAIALWLAVFLGGAAVGHVISIIRDHDLAFLNAGPILLTDLLTPAALLALLWHDRKPG